MSDLDLVDLSAAILPRPRLERGLYRGISRLRGRFCPDGYGMPCAIASAWGGDAQTAHRDTPDRIVINLIYFDDPVRDAGGQGGEFCLQRPRAGARLRGGIRAFSAGTQPRRFPSLALAKRDPPYPR